VLTPSGPSQREWRCQHSMCIQTLSFSMAPPMLTSYREGYNNDITVATGMATNFPSHPTLSDCLLTCMIHTGARNLRVSAVSYQTRRKLSARLWANQTSPAGDVVVTTNGCNAHASRNPNVATKPKSINAVSASPWGENYPASAVPTTGTAEQELSSLWQRQ
jgi:hypothetical protein